MASARRALLSTWHALQCGAMHMSLHRRCLPEQDSFRGSQMDADLFLGFKDELGNRVELQAPTPPGPFSMTVLNADHRVFELAVALSGTGPQWLA